MPRTSRAALVAGALLASATLAQAGDKGAFAPTSQDALVDLRPIVKTPEASAPAASVAAAQAPAPVKTRMSRRHARRAARATAVAALKGTFPAASAAASVPPGRAGGIEAAAPTPGATPLQAGPREAASGTLTELLARHAQANGVPLKLAQAVVRIESRGNVRAYNAGALGLMQIKYGTARAAGFSGPAMGLLVADTNLRYGMKILGDAYRAAGGDTCGALMRYQSGHYATRMSRANRVYCSRARAIMAGI